MSNDDPKAERKEIIRQLRETRPEDMMAAGEQAALNAFRRTIQNVPAYRGLVGPHVEPDAVSDIAAFRALPILDKRTTFGEFPIRDLCVSGNLGGVRSLLTSSGHSGIFSFGVNTGENLQRSARSIDLGLQYIFNVDEQRTLLINALPMGVKVHTTATVLAETSVRDDMVYALVNKFRDEFDQIILVGEGSFLKKVIEDGREEHRIPWEDLRVHLITGEEGIAENYRTYMGKLIGIEDFADRREKIVMSSMGVAELDLNIFHETHDTVSIRRLAHENAKLRAALFGPDARYCPMFFIYYPHRCFVETLPTADRGNELIISVLSDEMKLPLLRYRTGDYGAIHSFRDVERTLQEMNFARSIDLKLPFVSVSGRGHSVGTDTGLLYPEAVKEAIYAVPRLAARVTGNFRIVPDGAGGAQVLMQLKPGTSAPRAAKADFASALASYSDAKAELALKRYERFAYSMAVDYERKFRYI
jgi:phenylacetate-CoA ligase